MTARPTVAEERNIALGDAFAAWNRSGLVDGAARRAVEEASATTWKTSSLLARAGMFLLGLLTIAALYWFLDALGVPAHEWVTAAAALAASEVLIRKGRLFASGIEEALWLVGCFCIILGLPGPQRDEGLLLFALAFAIASWRLLNPLFAPLAVWLVAFYLGVKLDTEAATGWTVIAAGAVALRLTVVLWRRPYVGRAISIVAFAAAPVAWMVFAGAGHADGSGVPAWLAPGPLLGVAALAVAALLVGIRWRLHAPLAGGLLGLAAAGYELRNLFLLPDEAKLVLAGLALFGAAWVLERRLRDTRPITSRPLTADPFAPFAEMAAGAVVAPAPVMPETREGGGGGFGGAGSSGEW